MTENSTSALKLVSVPASVVVPLVLRSKVSLMEDRISNQQNLQQMQK